MNDNDQNPDNPQGAIPPAPPAPPASVPPTPPAPTTTRRTRFPVLPLRDIVVFPHMIVPLFVGREKSVRALEEVMGGDKRLMLVAQKNAGIEDPGHEEIHTTGTVGTVLQLLKLPDGSIKVLVEGGRRAKVEQFIEEADYLEANVSYPQEQQVDKPDETAALVRNALKDFEQYIKLNKKIPSEVIVSLGQIEEAGKLADTIAAQIGASIPEKQELLEMTDISKRLEKTCALMDKEIGLMQTEKRVRNRVKRQMEKSQREYYLNEQIKAIQKELGDGEDGRSEIDEIEAKIKKTRLSKDAAEKIKAEVKKLKSMSPMSAEATVVRNYVDTLLALPWKKRSRVKSDINEARKILDADHYGLEKIKERIVEYLAVQNRTRKNKGPILCLVGPPGVGKTSLGQSIARATGRKFARMALGGVRDESEIRGHRRTYIGSMPGKVIQSLKKVGTGNPLILLDEVDKLGSDWRGDPTSALLEVLDPEQNDTFQDHYLEVDYDLSDVMFITTANTLDMPQPLLDRMEIIRLSGYTEDEKLEIAKGHLIPKQMKNHGLKSGEITIDDDAIRQIIRVYTREAGVRNIEREIAKLARKAVTEITDGKHTRVHITGDNCGDYLGVPRFRKSEAEAEDRVGVTTGLAWTEVGGELLHIEAVQVPGKGKVSSTGKLGDVMKESIQATEFFIRSRADAYGIKHDTIQKHDIHVHIPEGATPKDGPSAGVAMVTSLVSALTGITVRADIAMTGEITLRGRVLGIGGLKEKLLAALRSGIGTVLIPEENMKDLAEIPENIKEGLTIIPVSLVDEVLENALTEKPIALPGGGDSLPGAREAAAGARKTDENDPDLPVITH